MRFKVLSSVLFVIALVVCSCSTPKNIEYLQDLDYGQLQDVQNGKEITVRPEDKLSIVVNSRDQELAKMFNLPVLANRIGESSSNYTTYTQNMSVYSVDEDGNINFPVLGKVKVAGKTRMKIRDEIEQQLKDRKLVNDAVVTVEFANLYVSVLGEVSKPGRYNLDRDKVTIMDALGMAGDLTIYGQRDSVVVLRREGDKQVAYKVNLTSSRDLLASPAYYLQQQDVIYVRPNATRVRQSTVNGNTIRSSSFWISVTSLVASVCALLLR
jgi:polysaccharide export outer membrane protein